MQTIRITLSQSQNSFKAIPVYYTARNMSLFPRFAVGEFAPLFRLLDDYATHTVARSAPTFVRSFQPRFDVKERKDAYELQGELPGIDQKNINIEFTDAQTLTVKGRTERQSDNDTPAAAKATESETQDPVADTASEHSKFHKASVEDEAATYDIVDDGQQTPQESQVSTTQSEQPNKLQPKPQTQPQHRYWVSERSVGEFQRTFSFPARVDQDSVKASLRNGILSIVVPKAAAPVSRRINVE